MKGSRGKTKEEASFVGFEVSRCGSKWPEWPELVRDTIPVLEERPVRVPVFLRVLEGLLVLPGLVLSLRTSRRRFSISRTAWFRSAVSSEASLLNTLAIS